MNEEILKKFTEKLSITEDEVKKDYSELVEDEKKVHPNFSDEDKEKRALQRLVTIYKKQLRSPAVGFEGCIIGIGDCIDTVARMRANAKKQFNENPQIAIQNGVTDEDGNPLDMREKWSDDRPNPNFGKPLPEHSYLRNIYGIALKTGKDDKPKFFSMSLSGKIADNEDMPLFKSLKFRAIDRTSPQDIDHLYTLNSSSFTEFKEDSSVKLPKPKELLETYCKSLFVDIDKLEQYHQSNAENYNRLCIVEGDVSMLVLDPTSTGSRRMVIEDAENLDIESPGITCWLPPRLDIDFGEQSKVLVIGRTAQGKKRDEAGNPTDEPGDMMLNVYGIYAIPDYKIKPTIKEMTEEDIVTEEEDEESDKKEESKEVQTKVDEW